MDVTLLRLIDSPTRATLGVLFIGGNPLYTTLEPPNKYNLPLVSCIPEGVYQCAKRREVIIGHKKPVSYNVTYEVETVAGRSGIYFHIGNYKEDTQGCILVGRGFNQIGITKSEDGFHSFVNKIDDPNLGDVSLRNKFVLTIRAAR